MCVTCKSYNSPLSFQDFHFLDNFFLMITRGREHLLNFLLAQASQFFSGRLITRSIGKWWSLHLFLLLLSDAILLLDSTSELALSHINEMLVRRTVIQDQPPSWRNRSRASHAPPQLSFSFQSSSTEIHRTQ